MSALVAQNNLRTSFLIVHTCYSVRLFDIGFRDLWDCYSVCNFSTGGTDGGKIIVNI